MKWIDKILCSIIAVVATGCSSDELPVPSGDIIDNGDSITLTCSMTTGEMPQNASRALTDQPSADMKLTVIEFAGTTPTSSNLISVKQVPLTSATNVADGTEVTFNLTLTKTDQPHVLHFVASNDYITVDQLGTAANVMSPLVTSDGVEAYWGRVAFPNGYCISSGSGENVTWNVRDDVKASLKKIPMLRNFAKISCKVKDGGIDGFNLLGFELVNVPTSALIAPFNTGTGLFQNFFTADGQMQSYDVVTSEYNGLMPGNAAFINSEATIQNWSATEIGDHFKKTVDYMYEHPFESTRRTYMIIHGTYNGTDGYYKVDLGKKDDSNIFQFYDILRNYEYAVTINSVTSVGAANPSLAIAGPPFNNLSAAIETLNIRGLSDGVNKIEVSGTSFVVVKQYTPQDPLVILYQYTENITSGSGTVKNDVPKIEGLKDGAVIDGTPQKTEVTIDGKKWMQISIATKVPTKEQQRQSFTITDSNGLGRTVTLVSHVPYEMSNIQVFNGLENERPNREPQNILATQGAPLTIFFDLPDGLPESIFPLEFQLESNRQNIENSKAGTLVVTTGTSLFEKDSDGNAIERPRISYIKTVSYNEYMYIADEDNKVDPTTSPVNKNHTVRCRFVTNVALSSLELPAGQNWTKTTVRIYNPYFDQGENYSKAETVFYRGDYTGN